MSTISDVARLAGVSAMTVSRVINNTGYISAETRARVEAAISELGYVPNALGRQLRSKQTKMLALIVSDITNPFFTTIARGVEDVAGHAGFTVMFCNTDESEAEEVQYVLTLIQRQVDGILLVPASSTGKAFRMLASHRVPVVVIDRRVDARNVDTVRCDSETGGYLLGRHLVELGHTRIAVLTGRPNVSTSVDRLAGCRRAVEEAGLTLDEDLVVFGEFNYAEFNQADGHRMARQVLAVDPPPTAIFAANNFIAFGALRAVREAGLRVPEDISIVAFDDLPAEWVAEPFLTVVAQPAYEIGRRAAELILERLGTGTPADGREVLLPSQLIVRGSSRSPMGHAAAATPIAPPASSGRLRRSADGESSRAPAHMGGADA
jgi:LacI family transcriptional regulator